MLKLTTDENKTMLEALSYYQKVCEQKYITATQENNGQNKEKYGNACAGVSNLRFKCACVQRGLLNAGGLTSQEKKLIKSCVSIFKKHCENQRGAAFESNDVSAAGEWNNKAILCNEIIEKLQQDRKFKERRAKF